MPEHVVGVGRFAATRAKGALDGLNVKVGGITHPSPANPQANRGWEARVAAEFRDLGIEV
jgi:single-strand selective monofunctional uracil DNA glycosylase